MCSEKLCVSITSTFIPIKELRTNNQILSISAKISKDPETEQFCMTEKLENLLFLEKLHDLTVNFRVHHFLYSGALSLLHNCDTKYFI